MSFLKPDLDYDPTKRTDMYVNVENRTIRPQSDDIIPVTSKEQLQDDLKLFMNNFSDMDFIRFYKISETTFSTSINVLDSISFFERFIMLYVGTLKKTYPKKDFTLIEQNLSTIKESLANMVRYDNVENKFLLPMVVGMLNATLRSENY